MSLGTYYWGVLKRAAGPPFDRARRIHFSVVMAAEIILLAARLLLTPATSVTVQRVKDYGWTVPIAYLVLAFLWRLVQVPHQLHLETLAKIPDRTRADARDGLRRLMVDFDTNLIGYVQSHGAHNWEEEIKKWVAKVETFLDGLGSHYVERLRAIPNLFGGDIHRHILTALRHTRSLLDDVMSDYS